ncbi:nucleoid-associated protein [Brachyspira pilosicoli]|uniref:nucleoid-associated protein n=1 Tax=Brachyspira pilosicoli TaxID=52584 RepID=UPI0012F51EDE|nr:nucleoid-associated protein [Brachyspira pilosicoli]
MEIKYAIIHELYRNHDNNKFKINFSKNILEKTDVVKKSLEEIDLKYKSKNKTMAQLENESIFYMKNLHTSENKFMDFTKEAMEKLKTSLENMTNVKGGYILFIEYVLNKEMIFEILLLRNKTSIKFIITEDSNFTINEDEHIDIDNIVVACKINLSQLENNNEKNNRYVSFASSKGDAISQYFLNWINIKEKIDKKTDLHNLKEILKNIKLPEDIDNRNEFYKKVHEIIITNNNTINVEKISTMLYNDKEYINIYASENNMELTEMIVRNKDINFLIRRIIKHGTIELKFIPDDLKSGSIEGDETDENKIIITSKELREQLEDILNDNKRENNEYK